MATKGIEEVLEENRKAIMSIPGVVGTGQGLCEGKPCIRVFVIKKNLICIKESMTPWLSSCCRKDRKG